MIQRLIREENRIFDEDCAGSEDEGRKEVDVYVVPGAVEFPAVKTFAQSFII